MQFARRQLPVIIAFLMGIGLWAQYYIPSEASQKALETYTSNWSVILAGCALILGIMSALQHHYMKVKLKKPGHGYSVITLVCFALMFCVGMWPRPLPGFSAAQTHDGSFYQWLFNNVFVPLDATMFSLLAFFIASAAFRAFRARSFEATVLLIAGCIVMLGRVPVGESSLITFAFNGDSYNLSTVADWIMNVPNGAAQRGIMLGVFLSQVAISLRIIFGIERTYMGGGD